MAKIKFRNIHINTEVWRYSVSNSSYILLTPPGINKNTIRIEIKDIVKVPYETFDKARKPNQGDNWMESLDKKLGMVTPSQIKDFIVENRKALMA